ncbi:hypothetical protein BDK51DRAFT_11695, partial [Blyttiomyces helicus]
LIEEIWASILTPGVNPRVQNVIDLAFGALGVSLVTLAVLTGGNVHVLALLTISAGLFASLRW